MRFNRDVKGFFPVESKDCMKEDFQRWTHWDLYFLKLDPLGMEESPDVTTVILIYTHTGVNTSNSCIMTDHKNWNISNYIKYSYI